MLLLIFSLVGWKPNQILICILFIRKIGLGQDKTPDGWSTSVVKIRSVEIRTEPEWQF